MILLTENQIRSLVDKVIDAKVRRDLLLTGIASHHIGRIPNEDTPGAQIFSDLIYLVNLSKSGEKEPLSTWLRNAIYFCKNAQDIQEIQAIHDSILSPGPSSGPGKEALEDTLFPHKKYKSYLNKLMALHGTILPFGSNPKNLLDLKDIFVDLDIFAPWAAKTVPDDFNKIPQVFSFEDCLYNNLPGSWTNRRWVLLGDPGSGKTTLLRRSTFVLASKEKMHGKRVLPFFFRISDITGTIESKILEALEIPEGSLTEPAWNSLTEEYSIFLFFDGLDEVNTDHRNLFNEKILVFGATVPDATIIISSRFTGYKSPGALFRDIYISPLPDEKRTALLTSILRNAGITENEIYRTLLETSRDPTLWSLCENPLLLTLVGLVAAKQQITGATKSKLLESIVSLLFSSEYRNQNATVFPQYTSARSMLSVLAFGMLKSAVTTVSTEELFRIVNKYATEELIDTILRENAWDKDLNSFFQTISKRTGLLVIENDPLPRWRFWHRHIQESLAAEYLENNVDTDDFEDLVRLVGSKELRQDFWVEPIALLAGRLYFPDPLIDYLFKIDPLLCLQAIRNVNSLDNKFCFDLIRQSSERFFRNALIPEIPRVAKNSYQTLEHLLILGRDTTDTNDLYWIVYAITTLLNKLNAKQAVVDNYIRSLFSHLPDPSKIETLLPPAIDRLWIEAPSGSFYMGSESTGNPDESPRHPITFDRPFLIMSIPFTEIMYRYFKGAELDPGDPDSHLPKTNVSWYEAQLIALWAGGCLPSEAQWEYCCRAGTDTDWIVGDSPKGLERYAWFDDFDAKAAQKPVGLKLPNQWGIYDLLGNVWEWCFDNYALYEEPSQVGKSTMRSDGKKILRGGCYWISPDKLTSSFRSNSLPHLESFATGFRIVRSSPP